MKVYSSLIAQTTLLSSKEWSMLLITTSTKIELVSMPLNISGLLCATPLSSLIYNYGILDGTIKLTSMTLHLLEDLLNL